MNNQEELRFYKESKCKYKCSRCGIWYQVGDPCFVQNHKGWHIDCATNDEKKNPFFQKWFKVQKKRGL